MRSILIVDDDADIRESIGDALEEEGYRVSGAANGQEALRLLKDEELRPGLILLDMMMPGMDGWRFRAEQRNDPDLVSSQKRDEETLRFLSEASRQLAESIDYETTLSQIARLVLPAIADWFARPSTARWGDQLDRRCTFGSGKGEAREGVSPPVPARSRGESRLGQGPARRRARAV